MPLDDRKPSRVRTRVLQPYVYVREGNPEVESLNKHKPDVFIFIFILVFDEQHVQQSHILSLC